MWLDLLNQGVEEGCFRPDLDVDLVYRFIRDTTWVSVRWYQPGGPLTAEQVGRAIPRHRPRRNHRKKELKCLRRTSSTLCVPRSASATDRWPACTRSIWAPLRMARAVRPCRRRPGAVDDVIAGCVDAIGAQAGNIARLSWLAAGYPEEVPGVTVDRQCGSSQQAISFGAQAIMSGTADLIVAGGMQNMSQIPISSAMTSASSSASPRRPTNPRAGCTATATRRSRSSAAAELIAEKWNLSREEMEQYALTSHQRAQAAIRGGHFDNEIIAVIDGRSASTRVRATRRWRRWPGSRRSSRAAG